MFQAPPYTILRNSVIIIVSDKYYREYKLQSIIDERNIEMQLATLLQRFNSQSVDSTTKSDQISPNQLTDSLDSNYNTQQEKSRTQFRVAGTI